MGNPTIATATDITDKFRDRQGSRSILREVKEKLESSSGTVVVILPELKDLPWNNITLCMVLSLDPTCIRVTGGEVTCDSIPGRITVTLNDDNKTIRRISKEVKLPLIGCDNGADLSNMLWHIETYGNLDKYKPDTGWPQFTATFTYKDES